MTQPIHTTSTANMHSFGTTGAGSAGASTGGWSSLSAKRTTSFSSIHKEVAQTISYSPIQAYTIPANEGSGEGGRPGDIGGGYTGEIIPEPIGDMLLPLLAMAAVYLIVKLMRNRKTSQAL